MSVVAAVLEVPHHALLKTSLFLLHADDNLWPEWVLLEAQVRWTAVDLGIYNVREGKDEATGPRHSTYKGAAEWGEQRHGTRESLCVASADAPSVPCPSRATRRPRIRLSSSGRLAVPPVMQSCTHGTPAPSAKQRCSPETKRQKTQDCGWATMVLESRGKAGGMGRGGKMENGPYLTATGHCRHVNLPPAGASKLMLHQKHANRAGAQCGQVRVATLMDELGRYMPLVSRWSARAAHQERLPQSLPRLVRL